MAGCGPQGTLLTATGTFEGLALESIRVPAQGAGGGLELELSEARRRATVRLDFDDDAVGCWRTAGDQHACTVAREAGRLTTAELRLEGQVCALEGWVERLDGAWQLDVTSGAGACPEGRLAALLEP